MQINWGKKLIIVYSVFVLGMGFMVYQCTLQKTDMVTSNYYEKELKYQEVIDGLQNANNLTTAISVVQADPLSITLTMPAEALQAKGSVEFYRPSDASKDFTTALLMDDVGQQFFERKKFIDGLYKVKVNWEKNGRQFYAEQSLFIQ
jgi:FixH